MLGRYQNVATRLGEAASYIRPEILAIPEAKMKKFLAAKELAHFALLLERLRRYRPYTLGEKEESLLAMQGEMAQAASRIFRQLLDADMTFGNVKDENGRIVELTHSTYMQLLHQGKLRCSADGVPSVLPAVPRSCEHAVRRALQLRAEGRLLRQSQGLRKLIGSRAFPRQRPAVGVRQFDCGRP